MNLPTYRFLLEVCDLIIEFCPDGFLESLSSVTMLFALAFLDSDRGIDFTEVFLLDVLGLPELSIPYSICRSLFFTFLSYLTYLISLTFQEVLLFIHFSYTGRSYTRPLAVYLSFWG